MQRRSRLALSPVALALFASSGLGCFGVSQDQSKAAAVDSGASCRVPEAGAVDASVDGALPDPVECKAYCPEPRPSKTTPISYEAVNFSRVLTQDEKFQLVSGAPSCTDGIWNADFNSTGVRRLDIPDWRMSDGPRGVHVLSGGRATTWAVAEARAASFDVRLEQEVGRLQGVEMTLLRYHVSLAPTINTLRHPRWARAQETYGEDPVLQGEMGAAFVLGMQERIVACPKHLVGNDTDNNRQNVIAHMDEQTLQENYMLPFRIVVDKSDPGCLMAAYNGVRGVVGSAWYQGGSQGWCTENDYVMTTVPRGEWKWNGVMISDWWATKYHAELSMNAGLDLEMPDSCAYANLSGVVPYRVPQSRIDEAVFRILNVRAKFNQLVDDTRKVDTSFLKYEGPYAAHRLLARRTAQEGAVLLKNDGILPIGPKAAALGDGGSPNVKSIIFLGPDADLPNVNKIHPGMASGFGDRGSSSTNPPLDSVSLMAGFASKGFSVTSSGDAAAANSADVAIIPVALAHEDEGEHYDGGFDRKDMTLGRKHPQHWGDNKPSAFIKQAAAANPRVIVLVMVGSAVMMDDWMDSVPAIVQTFYPGQEGGNAVADLLTGDINFSAKLPFTVAKNGHTAPAKPEETDAEYAATSEVDYPKFDNASYATDVEYLHGYRRIEDNVRRDPNRAPRFWFGFGKSYTSYAYSDLKVLCSDGITADGKLTVQVTVTNTGPMAGTEIVQLYIGGFPAGPRRPPKELKAFVRVPEGDPTVPLFPVDPQKPPQTLAPGESKVVTISVPAKDMAYWDQTTRKWVVQQGQHTVFVGPSADPDPKTMLSAPFTIK
jgi:beta-glucosidase